MTDEVMEYIDTNHEDMPAYCNRLLYLVDAYHDEEVQHTGADMSEIRDMLDLDRTDAIPPYQLEPAETTRWVYVNQDTGTRITYIPNDGIWKERFYTYKGSNSPISRVRSALSSFSLPWFSEDAESDEYTTRLASRNPEQNKTLRQQLEEQQYTFEPLDHDSTVERVNGKDGAIQFYEEDRVEIEYTGTGDELPGSDQLQDMLFDERRLEGDSSEAWLNFTILLPDAFKERWYPDEQYQSSD